MIEKLIENLLDYGCETNLIEKEDRVYCRNRMLALFHVNAYEIATEKTQKQLHVLLDEALTYAIENNIIEDSGMEKDQFKCDLMNIMMPFPREVTQTFLKKKEVDPKDATSYFFDLSRNSNYIDVYRNQLDEKWKVKSSYGEIDITINLSKPEKDPRDIAKAKTMVQSNYPSCVICKENVGYEGSANRAARSNHRVVPLTLDNEGYVLQYSPYVYYNEHCIVINEEHKPMVIGKHTFSALLDFVDELPHYFVGSNADLPIVGGSILAHDHYQGGGYRFAMNNAKTLENIPSQMHKNVLVGRVDWPVSSVRIQGEDKQEVLDVMCETLEKWKVYSDERVGIISSTNGELHNTITPIVRKENHQYIADLALRNNRTSSEHPMGIFHPHEEYHHIKKENIGLIEVMGLAVLPSRLKQELQDIEEAYKNGLQELSGSLAIHNDWYQSLREKQIKDEDVSLAMKQEVGEIFVHVLEDAGVYKQDEQGQDAFKDFLKQLV